MVHKIFSGIILLFSIITLHVVGIVYAIAYWIIAGQLEETFKFSNSVQKNDKNVKE